MRFNWCKGTSAPPLQNTAIAFNNSCIITHLEGKEVRLKMARYQVSFLLLALVGLFSGSGSCLDVPRSFVRRAGDDNSQMLHKIVQANDEFSHKHNTKRTLQVVEKSNTTLTEDQLPPLVSDILIGIAEIIIFAIADFVLEFITGILTGGAAIGSIAGDSVDGMNGAVNVTALTETVSSNVTVTIIKLDTGSSNQTVTEDQILEAIVPQIIELIVNGLASGLIAILSASIPIDIVVDILAVVINAVASALIDFLVGTILGILKNL
jgi:hypothetical protein